MLIVALKCLAVVSFICCCGWVLFVRRDRIDDYADECIEREAYEAELRKINESNKLT